MADADITALRSSRARVKIHVILYACQVSDIIANYLVSRKVIGCDHDFLSCAKKSNFAVTQIRYIISLQSFVLFKKLILI